jgi:hypothetical protein
MSTHDIRNELAAVERAAEARSDEKSGKRYRNRQPRRDPSQVYSIRIPVERLESLRQLAAERDVAPTALMRSWVLERLEQETSLSGPVVPVVPPLDKAGPCDASRVFLLYSHHKVTGSNLRPSRPWSALFGVHGSEMID